MKKTINTLLALLIAAVLVSCGSETKETSHRIDNPNLREVVVKEIVQTSSYTYLKMKEEGAVYWGAIPRRDDIKEGGTYYFDNYQVMKDFQSRELDKTFESVYFIELISDKPIAVAKPMPSERKGSSKVGNMEIENLDPVEGGISLGELYAKLDTYEGKMVKIRGIAVKYTSAVMQKNWVHIQDGTQHGENFDLTITTTDEVVQGDLVTFEGKIILNKDFGHGYFYEVLMENAVLLEAKKQSSLQ